MTGDPLLLVGEDDADVVALVERVAEPLGISVAAHGSGRAAIAAIPTVRPDAILLDSSGIEGTAALAEIHELDPECHVILMTNDTSVAAAIGSIKGGALDYLTKPSIPEVLRAIAEISSSSGVRVANVFHAGDGNLHPLVLFDGEQEGAGEAAEKVSGAILDLCISHGGSITGEHGVGTDKAAYMPKMFTDADLDTMQLVRCAFDPHGLANPGKVFPTPRLCGEVPGRHKGAHPLQEAGIAEVF